MHKKRRTPFDDSGGTPIPVKPMQTEYACMCTDAPSKQSVLLVLLAFSRVTVLKDCDYIAF